MMRTGKYDKSWIHDSESGQIIGLCLGFEVCTEHESGIEPLRELLGMPPAPLKGLASRLVRTVPADTITYTLGTKMVEFAHGLVSVPFAHLRVQDTSSHSDEYVLFHQTVRDESFPPSRVIRAHIDEAYDVSHAINASWDDTGFDIKAFGAPAVEHLGTLYDALLRHDLVVTLANGGPLGNDGLSIAIASRVSPEAQQRFLDKDLEHIESSSHA